MPLLGLWLLIQIAPNFIPLIWEAVQSDNPCVREEALEFFGVEDHRFSQYGLDSGDLLMTSDWIVIRKWISTAVYVHLTNRTRRDVDDE